jgi:hypothetical protein
LKVLKEKKVTKLLLIKDKDVIGLDDCLYNGKYTFTVELVSVKGEMYRIKRKVWCVFIHSCL